MAVLYNAMQLKNGAKVETNRMGNLTQPIQFLPRAEKDDQWCSDTMDWLERQGLVQIKRNARNLLKNYKLANGIIDKSDYIAEENNEEGELIDFLKHDDDTAFELKFFPIIPNVISILTGEFSKRTDKVSYRAVDEDSYNEMTEAKRGMIEQVLLQEAEQKMQMIMQGQQIDPKSEQGQQMMSPENMKKLPEIERFFRKDYRSMAEEWAGHQHAVDCERFHMNELENVAFKDSLIADREFWHFAMREDDYEVELWNPLTTFYHKSPDVRYTSQGNHVGNIALMTVSDVIDRHGYLMTAEQLENLENLIPIRDVNYLMEGQRNDGGFYNPTKSHEWNTTGPSVAMRQFTTARDLSVSNDVINQILAGTEDMLDYGDASLQRVVTAYWKSRRKVGHITMIDEQGMVSSTIIDETFKVTEKPQYDTTIVKSKSAANLLMGQHIDWIWINETWGGIKVGPNKPTSSMATEDSNQTPIYLNVKPLRFQFKGDFTLYGCRLPVEGSVFSDRNTKSVSLVDKLKPFQIGYNLVNNQIADILIDELGTVVLLDQNMLPQHSMGEDWGENNLSKAFVAMKDFQMLPLDTSVQNTKQPLSFQSFKTLDLSQTARLMGRIQLATYFKSEAFESIGITQQRRGQVNSQETATGVTQAINMSYSQTENYFMQHSEFLMPRVHEMRTNLAQYYHSNKPSIRLSYMTSADEKVNFQINGTELLARDINVFATTKVNHKYIMEKIRDLAIQNNTSGATIYDLGAIMTAETLAELTTTMKGIEDKAMNLKLQQQQYEQSIHDTEIQQANDRLLAQHQFDAEQNDKDRENLIAVAEVKASSFLGDDKNKNGQPDYMDAAKFFEDKRQKDDEMSMKHEQFQQEQGFKQQELALKQRELQTREHVADKQLQIAAVNKNKYDVPKKK
jgi:hypothetical protein